MPALWDALDPSIYAFGIDITQAALVTNVQGTQPAIWLPDLIFPDAVEQTVTDDYVKLYPLGSMRLVPIGHLPGGYTNPPVDYIYNYGSTTPSFAMNPIWALDGSDAEFVISRLNQGYALRSTGIVNIHLSRKSAGVILRIGIPIILLVFLACSTFWAAYEYRMGTTITLMLA
eukprot:gene26767-33396_t